MTETKVIICKVCQEPKTLILAGKYGDSKNKKWVDEEGKAANGKVCAKCNTNRVKENMQKMRFERKLDKPSQE